MEFPQKMKNFDSCGSGTLVVSTVLAFGPMAISGGDEEGKNIHKPGYSSTCVFDS
jgi:hypothetical protein